MDSSWLPYYGGVQTSVDSFAMLRMLQLVDFNGRMAVNTRQDSHMDGYAEIDWIIMLRLLSELSAPQEDHVVSILHRRALSSQHNPTSANNLSILQFVLETIVARYLDKIFVVL